MFGLLRRYLTGQDRFGRGKRGGVIEHINSLFSKCLRSHKTHVRYICPIPTVYTHAFHLQNTAASLQFLTSKTFPVMPLHQAVGNRPRLLFCKTGEWEDKDRLRHTPVEMCARVQRTTRSISFSIKLPCTVNQLGNVNRLSHAEIFWLTIISETRSWITVPRERRGGRSHQLLPAIHNSPPRSLLLAIVNYAIPGVNLHNPELSGPSCGSVARWQARALAFCLLTHPRLSTSVELACNHLWHIMETSFEFWALCFLWSLHW